MASEVRIILGKRGSGKSTALAAMLASEPRVLLYDTLGESTYDRFDRVKGIPALCARLAADPTVFRLAYSWDGSLERDHDFDLACRAAYACRSMVFAVDEIDLFCAPTYLPRHLDMLVSMGRHRGLSFYCATRRPKEIPALIRSQAHRVLSFAQTEPADLEWCRAVMGDAADELAGLGPHASKWWLDSSIGPAVES